MPGPHRIAFSLTTALHQCAPPYATPAPQHATPQAPAALLRAHPVHRPPSDWACPEPRSQLLITHFSTLGWSLHALTHVAHKAVLEITEGDLKRRGVFRSPSNGTLAETKECSHSGSAGPLGWL